MRKLKTQIEVALALGALSLLAGLASHLALTDIYHGESDVTLEWTVVQTCELIFLAFMGMALFTLIRTLKAMT